VFFGCAEQDGQEALAVEDIRDGAAGGFYVSRQDVDVFDQCVADGAGFYPAGPAGDKGRLQARVIAGPLAEGEARSLLADDYNESVVGDLVFVQHSQRLGDLAVVVGDLGEIAGHVLAGFFGVDEVGGQFELGRIVARGVTFVPGRVRFVGALEDAEGGAGFDALSDEFVGERHVRVVVTAVFEGKGLGRSDVPLAVEGDTVAEGLEVVDDALDAGIDVRMVGICAALDGVYAGVDVVSRRRAHGGGLEAVLEPHPFTRQLVNVGGVGLSAVAADIAEGAVIGNYEHKVRFLRFDGAQGNPACTGQYAHRRGLQEFTSSHRVAPFAEDIVFVVLC